MRSSVFPEPAGACTMKERVGSSARSRCARSGMVRASFIGIALAIGRVRRRFLRDAAERLLPAVLARLVAALRIHARIARREAAADRVELDAPTRDERGPVAIAPCGEAPVLVDRDDAGNEVGCARD